MHPMDAVVSARSLSVGGGPNIPLCRPFLGKATGLAFLLAEFRRLCYIARKRVDRGGLRTTNLDPSAIARGERSDTTSGKQPLCTDCL
jgi:hypothetical protein